MDAVNIIRHYAYVYMYMYIGEICSAFCVVIDKTKVQDAFFREGLRKYVSLGEATAVSAESFTALYQEK